MPDVNPQILIWARETAGLDAENAAKKLGIKPKNLVKMEDGSKSPTRTQLYNMSDKYRRPLLAFYLQEPPREGDYGEDFRTLPRSSDPLANANLKALMRDVSVRQMLVSDVLEEEESPILNFINSASLEDKPSELAKKISLEIKFDLTKFRKFRNKEDAFKYLRNKIEEAGIFVLLIGNLGSHHSNIPVGIFRGFVLADNYAPFIVINPDDSKRAMAFTALHELAHLYLGQSGISGCLDSHQNIEKFCNDTAAEILLPSKELGDFHLADIDSLGQKELSKKIGNLSESYNISRSMLAYKLFRWDKIDSSTLEKLLVQFRGQYITYKEKNKASSPPMHLKRAVIIKSKLGALCSLTQNMINSESITYTKAAKILGVKVANVGTLVRDF